MGVLLLMMFLTTADVTLRYFLNRPIKGAFELSEFMMVVIVFFGLAYTAAQRGHVSVELVVSRFGERVQALIDSVTSLLSLGIFSLITWQTALNAKAAWLSGEVSMDLQLPVFVFKSLVPLGSLVLCLELLVSLTFSLIKVSGR